MNEATYSMFGLVTIFVIVVAFLFYRFQRQGEKKFAAHKPTQVEDVSDTEQVGQQKTVEKESGKETVTPVYAVKEKIKVFDWKFPQVQVSKIVWFRVAIFLCMGVSIIDGSYIFTNSASNYIMALALAATIDVGLWILIESSISLKKRGYSLASWLVTFLVIGLTVISYCANLAFNLQHFKVENFSAVEEAWRNYIVYLQSCPPLLVGLMTLVSSSYIVPSKELESEDSKSFKERLDTINQRRLDKLEAKLSMQAKEREIKNKYAVAKKPQGKQQHEVTTLKARITELEQQIEDSQKQLPMKSSVQVEHDKPITEPLNNGPVLLPVIEDQHPVIAPISTLFGTSKFDSGNLPVVSKRKRN